MKDPFIKLLTDISEEHSSQLSWLKQENKDLTERLNVILQATWSMAEDDWVGKPSHGGDLDSIQTLRLVAAADTKRSALSTLSVSQKQAWVVPDTFDNPQRKVDEDPDNFELREPWEQSAEDQALSKGKRAQNDFKMADHVEEETDEVLLGFFRHLITHPTSPKRMAWDIAGMVLLFWDILMVPIQAFNPEANDFSTGADWFCLFFWTFDILASFLTGYVSKQGEAGAVMRPSKIAKHYMTGGWFVLDLIIVVPDWSFNIVTMAGLVGSDATDGDRGGKKTARLLRAFRMVRVLRLLRLAKMRKLLQMAKDLIHSEVVFKIVNITQFVIILAFANHFLGAIWYVIGDIQRENDEDNWITAARIEGAPLHYRYFASLQWSLSQFTLGTDFAQPQNALERIFGMMLMLGGMLCFCFFTAYTTNSMMQVSNNTVEASKQMWLLRRYLRQENVPKFLTFRVLRYAEYECKHQKEHLPESSLSILALLSDGLRTELRFEANFANITVHPLFARCLENYRVSVLNMAHGDKAVLSRLHLSADDVIFKVGTWAHKMYFSKSGEIQYQRPTDGGIGHMCEPNTWFCEAALWVQWMTRGTIKAHTFASVVGVDVSKFSEAVAQDDGWLAECKNYASHYLDWLNNEPLDALMDISVGEESMEQAEEFLHFGFETEKEKDLRRKKARQSRAKGGGKLEKSLSMSPMRLISGRKPQ